MIMKRFVFLLVDIATAVDLVLKPSYAQSYFDFWSARWTTPGPMLRLYPRRSPYADGLDNPMRVLDPNGSLFTHNR